MPNWRSGGYISVSDARRLWRSALLVLAMEWLLRNKFIDDERLLTDQKAQVTPPLT